jgi:hypothetical protein
MHKLEKRKPLFGDDQEPNIDMNDDTKRKDGPHHESAHNTTEDNTGGGVNGSPNNILRMPNHAVGTSSMKAKPLTLFKLDDTTWDVDNLLGFDRNNDPSNVIGNRFLCRGDSLLLFGPTGIGKSSLVMQGMIEWALGRSLFGLSPVKPLKCLLIQAENNEGDLAIAFQDIVRGMNLTSAQIGQLRSRLTFKQVSSKTGPEFARYAKKQIGAYSPDVVIADPLLSYLGGNISDQTDVSAFLRNHIQPIMNETGVIWIFIHHTGKPSKDTTGGRDPIFDFLGSIEILNWAREAMAICIQRWDEREFKIVFRKRAVQANLVDENGNRKFDIHIKHSRDGVVWEQSSGSAASAGSDSRARDFQKQQDIIRNFIIEYGRVYECEIETHAKQNNVPLKTAKSIAESLSKQDGASPRIRKDKDTGGSFYTTALKDDGAVKSERETGKQLARTLVRTFIESRDFVSAEHLRNWATVTDGVGKNSVKSVADSLLNDWLEPTIHTAEVYVNGSSKKSWIYSAKPIKSDRYDTQDTGV